MDRLVIRPNGPLHGRVRVQGAKNSALKLMAACLLAEGRHELRNVPRIVDVEIMSEMLRAVGASVDREGPTLFIEVPAVEGLVPVAPYELVDKMRASIVVLGPLLARCGEARISMPGGDDFGSRPINFHIDGLAQMGTRFVTRHGFIEGSVGPDPAHRRLVGTKVVLEYPSHTTTDNLMMAAALASGTTVIENAAREPEVCDLAGYLNEMGARVRGSGTSRLEITGVDALESGTHSVVPDRVVAGTLAAATAIAGGEVELVEARADHMEMYTTKLRSMGVEIEAREGSIWVGADGSLESADVATLPYPGVATDYKPMVVTMLAVAQGVAIVTENLFEGRFRYVDELRRMGADIRTEGHHAVVRGVKRLSGAQVRSPDIRGGAALVLAGLVAEGETVLTDAHHLDRGYEDLAGMLSSLGGDVRRA
ncbi:MAG: UDP-N-acetylglucosamine 1-carboxyvinyltransferase [Acidimicrobiales bacterium]